MDATDKLTCKLKELLLNKRKNRLYGMSCDIDICPYSLYIFILDSQEDCDNTSKLQDEIDRFIDSDIDLDDYTDNNNDNDEDVDCTIEIIDYEEDSCETITIDDIT